jgi:hypothetical protein
MNKLYDYIFHYNSVEGLWYAIKREDFTKYFNEGEKQEKFLHDEEINNLLYKLVTG